MTELNLIGIEKEKSALAEQTLDIPVSLQQGIIEDLSCGHQ